MFCNEHPQTAILEDSGGRGYCPRCVDADVSPGEVFPLLVRLATTVRDTLDGDWGDAESYGKKIEEMRSALDDAEEFLELHVSE